jgi:hypothetical protein
VKLFTALVTAILFCTVDLKAGTPPAENAIYDPNTNHLWNRLNETLFVRTAQDGKKFGPDELDILYWFKTTNLVTEPSHHAAIAILDEFNNTHGEKLVRDALKRALLQRDLWELFDWSAKSKWRPDEAHARRELQSQLAVAIRRLALTTNEIAALPDNYLQTKTNNAPDLPRGLTETNGDWLGVSDQNDSLTAPAHVSSFDGHSTFQVLLHVPGGRIAAENYLEQLRDFARTNRLWAYHTNNFKWASTNEPDEVLALNPAIPQFPTNTEWALVRRMCVIDADGKIQPTAVTESIQLRRFYAFTLPTWQKVTNSNGYPVMIPILPVNFYEFQMNRRQDCALRELGQEERGFNFVHFRGMGFDQVEYTFKNDDGERQTPDSSKLQSVTLRTCTECHSATGIFSVNSYTRSFSESSQRSANLMPLDFNRELMNTTYWKQRQYDWGLLQGIWNQKD